MNTCEQLALLLSKRIHTLYGKEACQTSTHIACQVPVWRTFRDFIYQIIRAFQTENKILIFLFNINRAMARIPVYLLIFLIVWSVL
jgi:hypothetical protein